MTAPVSPGSSGSPVLDESGNVIGIATQVLKEGQNLNFAISAETIRDAIAKASVVAPTPTPYAAMTPTPSVGTLSAWYYLDRAVKDAGNENWEGAIADYTEAIRLEPNNPSGFGGRGTAYNYLKQYRKAVSDFTEAIRLEPDFTSAYWSRGNAYYYGLKEYSKAVSDYTETIRLWSSDDMFNVALMYEIRAKAYDKLGKSSEAAQDRKKAKELRVR